MMPIQNKFAYLESISRISIFKHPRHLESDMVGFFEIEHAFTKNQVTIKYNFIYINASKNGSSVFRRMAKLRKSDTHCKGEDIWKHRTST